LGPVIPSLRARGILTGKAAEAILGFVRQEPVDLLVMGTHGRTGLMHFVMGSVAEEVVRHADCPVLVARGSSGQRHEPVNISVAT
jgi:nucleotide-binding universal stress UspA family protein